MGDPRPCPFYDDHPGRRRQSPGRRPPRHHSRDHEAGIFHRKAVTTQRRRLGQKGPLGFRCGESGPSKGGKKPPHTRTNGCPFGALVKAGLSTCRTVPLPPLRQITADKG